MLRALLAFWFVAAVLIGGTGALASAPLPPPAFALMLTIVAVGAVWLVPELQRRVRGLGIGPLVAFHLSRVAAGAYFLVLAGDGVLPAAFANVAGWGDIAVGLAVLPVLMFAVPAKTSGQRTALLIWNTAGLGDILLVLVNGLRLFRANPEVAAPFQQLPLAVLPLFVVPIVIASHLWIFAWTARAVAPLPIDPIVPPPEEEEEAEADDDSAPRRE